VSLFSPKCQGIQFYSNRIDSNYQIESQTLVITSSAFDDLATKILVHVSSDKDISDSGAIVQMFKNDEGLLTTF